MKNKINDIILRMTGLCFIKPSPKHSIRFAKDYFMGRKVKVVEIGTYKGENAKQMFKHLEIDEAYLIDPYKEYSDGRHDGCQNYKKEIYLQKAKKMAHKLLQSHRNVTWIEMFSDKAVEVISTVDFIYIDGEHTYDQVMKDLENYYPKLDKCGIIAGHDISIHQVLNAVQDFCSKNKLHFCVAGQDWWIVKQWN